MKPKSVHILNCSI